MPDTMAQPTSSPALQVSGVSKRFGNTQALCSVDLSVANASIHALLGHNGSGKSTLIKVLAGFHQPDDGVFTVAGSELPQHHNPRQAHAAGLRFVHQDLGLVPGLSVAENLALGMPYETGPSGTIRWQRQYASAVAELTKLEMDLDPHREVESLGPVEQTMVAVARSLQGIDHDRSVLFLDEPTARLPRSEVDRLLDILDTLRRHGVAVVYVTHRLDEVFASADTVTILRDGEQVFSSSIRDTSETAVSRLIIGKANEVESGRSTPTRTRSREGERRAPVVELRGVSGRRVHDIDLRIQIGEIVAVTGLVGSGRSELGRLMYGVQPMSSGQILIRQTPMRRLSPRRCKAAGMGYSPQERGQGLVTGLDVKNNLAITSYKGLFHGLGLSNRKFRRMAAVVIERLSIRPPIPDQIIDTLSGGNQQKVALGKWTRQRLALLILDEPLQGIDVGAKADIMSTIRVRAKEQGLAVLWLESDIQEVPRYADRTLVMRDGRISVELPGNASHSELLSAVYDKNYAGGSGQIPDAVVQEATS